VSVLLQAAKCLSLHKPPPAQGKAELCYKVTLQPLLSRNNLILFGLYFWFGLIWFGLVWFGFFFCLA